jgi:hypothetical protein
MLEVYERPLLDSKFEALLLQVWGAIQINDDISMASISLIQMGV